LPLKINLADGRGQEWIMPQQIVIIISASMFSPFRSMDAPSIADRLGWRGRCIKAMMSNEHDNIMEK
jgi:hypothetical protein